MSCVFKKRKWKKQHNDEPIEDMINEMRILKKNKDTPIIHKRKFKGFTPSMIKR